MPNPSLPTPKHKYWSQIPITYTVLFCLNTPLADTGPDFSVASEPNSPELSTSVLCLSFWMYTKTIWNFLRRTEYTSILTGFSYNIQNISTFLKILQLFVRYVAYAITKYNGEYRALLFHCKLKPASPSVYLFWNHSK